MEQDASAPQSIADILREHGIPVTAEGMARWGEILRERDAQRDHAARDAFLAQLRQGRVAPE